MDIEREVELLDKTDLGRRSLSSVDFGKKFDPAEWKPHKLSRGPRKNTMVFRNERTNALRDTLPEGHEVRSGRVVKKGDGAVADGGLLPAQRDEFNRLAEKSLSVHRKFPGHPNGELHRLVGEGVKGLAAGRALPDVLQDLHRKWPQSGGARQQLSNLAVVESAIRGRHAEVMREALPPDATHVQSLRYAAERGDATARAILPDAYEDAGRPDVAARLRSKIEVVPTGSTIGSEKLYHVRVDGRTVGHVSKAPDTRSTTHPWKAFATTKVDSAGHTTHYDMVGNHFNGDGGKDGAVLSVVIGHHAREKV